MVFRWEEGEHIMALDGHGCQDTPIHRVFRRQRSRERAKQLSLNVPAVYPEDTTFYTDRYEVYKGGALAQHKFPLNRTRSVGREVIDAS